MLKNLYFGILQRVLRRSFPLWERLGFHVTPNHFFYPIPDTRRLPPALWQKHSELIGIELNEAAQSALLREFTAQFKSEYGQLPRTRAAGTPQHQYVLDNGSFSAVDGEILYCMIRQFKPRRMIEIGSGASTLLSAQAVLKNAAEGRPCEFAAIEPYPDAVVRAGVPGLQRLISRPLEDVPLSEFEALEANDILFIDSTHVLKIGGDVQYEYLELLPRLKPGVLVHIHDIFLPAEYPREWVLRDRYFWTEQYLLQAFLAFNHAFEVLWGSSVMHLRYPAELQAAFASYDPTRHWPGSFWMRRRAVELTTKTNAERR